MIRIANIKASLDVNMDKLLNIVLKKTGIKKSDIKEFKIHKKSVDARDKRDVHFVYTFDISLNTDECEVIKHCRYANALLIEPEKETEKKLLENSNIKRPVIVGSGPAGLFAALTLLERGLYPIILERGKDVEKRQRDIEKFWSTGELNVNSNVQFGEGGAGTFSDGKLTTNINDKNCYKVIDDFIKAGAPEEISYYSKPHIGTDKLKIVIKNIRQKIISMGGEFKFENQLIGFEIEDNKIVGVDVLNIPSNNKYRIETDRVILAIGHSSRDTFEMIYNSNVNILQKAFSIGARVEHSKKMIDESQYGIFANHFALGAADYKLVAHLSSRSVYTFCMCPGGFVVAASSEKNRLVVNGMSEYARDNINSNSALLVSITPEDFKSDNPLAGMYLQREIEEKAFKLGGSNYNAPIQLLGDFLENRASVFLGSIMPSYTPGVTLTDLSECLPNFVVDSMREAIIMMDKRLKGFASYDAILTGVETRSSSPIRIVRDENFESNIKGLYPCGEGAGYAGGIMSAAVDGINCALKIIENIENANSR